MPLLSATAPTAPTPHRFKTKLLMSCAGRLGRDSVADLGRRSFANRRARRSAGASVSWQFRRAQHAVLAQEGHSVRNYQKVPVPERLQHCEAGSGATRFVG